MGAAMLVVASLVAGACSKAVDTGEVSARTGEYGASLETSTTVDRVDAILQGRRARPSGSGGTKASATQAILDEIARNPEFAEQLENLTPQQLSELTGLSVEELDGLGVTPASVASLGKALVATRGTDSAPGNPTLALLAGSSGALSAEAVEVLSETDPTALAAVFGASANVDPSVTEPLGRWLKVVDPNGLGQYSEDQSALAMISVLLGTQLGRDAVPLENFAKLSPDLQAALGGFGILADNLTPKVVRELNRITTILGPNTIKAMLGAFSLLDRPQVAQLITKAIEDPMTLNSILGAAVFLIPGLAETIYPFDYDTTQDRIKALGTIFITALVRTDPAGLQTFLQAIGIEVPPQFWQTLTAGIPPA